MAGSLAYSLHIKIPLKDGKNKYPQIGAIVKDNVSGHLYGNLEMRPWGDWDGKFYLFIPKKKGGVEQPEGQEQNVDEIPF